MRKKCQGKTGENETYVQERSTSRPNDSKVRRCARNSAAAVKVLVASAIERFSSKKASAAVSTNRLTTMTISRRAID